MATQWFKARLGSPLGLFFISSFHLHNRVRRYSQGPQSNCVLRLLFLMSYSFVPNRINNLMFAFIATIQLQISLSALSPSF